MTYALSQTVKFFPGLGFIILYRRYEIKIDFWRYGFIHQPKFNGNPEI